ncbi:MAG: hypothetical protein FJ299_00835 [Planctomycetes bacterium]|nr:hypothetical protein [Planctomycetota bacterium]
MERRSNSVRRRGPSWSLLAGLLCLCCAPARPMRVETQLLPTPDTRVLVGSPIAWPRGAEFDEIARLEDARDTSGRLQQLLEHADARVRARACLALGRCPNLPGAPRAEPPIGPLLCARLADADIGVRASAAFALGLRAEAGSGPILASLIPAASDIEVRARLVEAASRHDDEFARSAVLAALQDPDPRVRVEAALGIARWKRDLPGGEAADQALIAALANRQRAAAPGGAAGAAANETLDFEAASLFALSRRSSPLGRAAFLTGAQSSNPLARIFAMKGLATLATDAEIGATLQLALNDLDWRVACEAALALEARPTEGATAALSRSIEHASSHVRRAAALALPRCVERASAQSRELAVQGVERALRDVSPAVRGGALIARTRLDLLEPSDAEPQARQSTRTLAPARSAHDHLREWMRAADPHLRVAAATASALLPAPEAVTLLAELTSDEHPLVAGAAIEELGKLGTPEALSIVRAALVGADDGVRLAAVMALGEAANPQDVPLLEQALTLASGEIEPEIAFNTARLLGRIGGEEARRLCLALAAHEDAYVRSVARSTCFERFDVPEDGPPAAPISAPPAEPRLERPARNPLVRIDTTRGSLVFELYPAECPLHVHSFLTKARAGFYEDTPFHRVVPDFVVQGGDARGDGNGGASWRGDSLRNEFTPRKFARGTLGMPRNDNPDSGGSQIFITHRATPHLDGRYTAFGDLRAGADVLDRLEIGDRILAIVELRVASR